MASVFFASASSAFMAAFLSHSVVAVPAVHDSSDCTNGFAFVGRGPGQQGTGENGCVRSKTEEQLTPRIDARRLVARCAAAVLVKGSDCYRQQPYCPNTICCKQDIRYCQYLENRHIGYWQYVSIYWKRLEIARKMRRQEKQKPCRDGYSSICFLGVLAYKNRSYANFPRLSLRDEFQRNFGHFQIFFWIFTSVLSKSEPKGVFSGCF